LISAESREEMNQLLNTLDEDVNVVANIKEKWNSAFDDLTVKSFYEKLESCTDFKSLDINSDCELTETME